MYLRNNKDPQFKIGVLSSQWWLKHSVCIRVAKREHWTPSLPLPWDLAFRLNSFSKYYFSLQSISAIYHTLLAHLDKKTALHEQTTKMEGDPTAKNVEKGARFEIQRESEARMLVRLVIFLNVLQRVPSCSDNHLLLGANCEDVALMKAYTCQLSKEMVQIEGKSLTTTPKWNQIGLKFELIPSDMKWMASHSGELNNCATYFSSLANVSQQTTKKH